MKNDFEDKNRKNWTISSDNYSRLVQEELSGWKKGAWEKLLDQAIAGRENLTILDIGVGPGFFSILLSKKGYKVYAIDQTEAMLDKARANFEKFDVDVEFRKMDAHDLDFEDEKFDLIVNRNVTWTLYDAKSAYKEWKRVLKKDGKIVVFDANWNRRFVDEKAMKEYMDDDKFFMEKYGRHIDNYSEKELMETYRANAPMNNYLRPNWDLDTLLDLDYSEIYCKKDISKLIWSQEEQDMYRSRPMFMIIANK